MRTEMQHKRKDRQDVQPAEVEKGHYLLAGHFKNFKEGYKQITCIYRPKTLPGRISQFLILTNELTVTCSCRNDNSTFLNSSENCYLHPLLDPLLVHH